MITSEHAELSELLDRTWHELGGRGTKAELVTHVHTILPDHLRSYLIEQGLASKAGAYLRRTGADGLPQAPEIDAHGTHAQLELLDESEFRYVVARQMDNSRAARHRAQQLADLAFERLGVVISIDDPFAQAAS